MDEKTTILEYMWDRLRKSPAWARGYLEKVKPGGNLKPSDFPKENPKANQRVQPRVAIERRQSDQTKKLNHIPPSDDPS